MYTLSATTLDGILLFVKVKNLLHCHVKQWLHVDLTNNSICIAP